MMGELMLGCSGWNYPDTADKGGWTGVFYPDKDTKRLRYYSQFFNTAEMDSTFYEKFYSHMTKGTFIGMSRATPEKFQFSIKVPETVTHVKRLDIKKGAMTSFEEFLDKISPLRTANKLGAVLFQLPPSFTVNDFKNIKQFLDRLPASDSYEYAVEFRHTATTPSASDVVNVVTNILARPYMNGLSQYGVGNGTLRGAFIVTSPDPPNTF